MNDEQLGLIEIAGFEPEDLRELREYVKEEFGVPLTALLKKVDEQAEPINSLLAPFLMIETVTRLHLYGLEQEDEKLKLLTDNIQAGMIESFLKTITELQEEKTGQ